MTERGAKLPATADNEDQVAAALAQRVHGLADVGRHQPGGQRQALAAQAADPFRKEAQSQRVGGGDLQHLALLALDKQGRAGGFALQPGFTFAVTDATGRTRIERAGALFA